MSSFLPLRFVKLLSGPASDESKLITILAPRLAKQQLLPFAILFLLYRYAKLITVLGFAAFMYCYLHDASPSVPENTTSRASQLPSP